MMNTLILTLITVLAVFSCSHAAETLPFPEIIPFPQHVESSRGTFDASEAEVVCPDELDSLSKAYILSFSDRLSSVLGHSAGKNRIVFKTDPSIKDEAYSIKITPRKIIVRASGLNGLVYAVQTLKQMMPAEIYGTVPAPDADWLLPCCTIDDCPRCQAKIKELGLEDYDKHTAEHYLQSHVMKRMAQFLAERGKKIIGWEEMLQGELPQGSTVMAWRRNKYGHQAARLGHDAIMTTRTNLYFDRYQSEDKDNELLVHSSYLPVEMVWSFDPYMSEDKDAEPLTQEQKDHILGIQANVWREYIPTDSHLEYMVCPRISALAEVQWLMPEGKDWERFRRGMDRIRKVYEVLGCSYATHFWQSEQELE